MHNEGVPSWAQDFGAFAFTLPSLVAQQKYISIVC